MIQLLRQRRFAEDSRAVFVYTDPPIIVPNLGVIYRNFNEILEKLAESERHDLFYTVAHHSGATQAQRPQRTAATFEYQSVLAWDIDGNTDQQRSLEYAQGVAKVLEAPSEALTVVASGGGVHVVAPLKHPIRSVKFFDENREAYKEVCAMIDRVLFAAGLPGKCDPSIFEPARVLRLPGSMNAKPGRDPRPCQMIQPPTGALLEIDLFKLSGISSRKEENVSATEIRRHYPVPDFQEMVTECRFVHWALEHPKDLHEPQVFDMLSILAPQTADAKATIPGPIQVSPRELAEQVFKSATSSASLKSSDFDDKWEQAKKYGGRKCSTIHNHWIGGCEGCPHWGKIPTPLALKSKEHVASATLGYWTLTTEGNYKHPAYEDLAKVYAAGNRYHVTEDERVLTHNGRHYEPTADIWLKAWVEDTVTPTEPLREVHRNEFLRKVKSSGAKKRTNYEEFFIRSIRGKLNCANGIVDILRGVVMPHSPDVGFLYTLPYDVNPEEEGSELFLEWLAQITQDRSELMDSILDLMAYSLWPSYDDHLFAYFVGEGANGKSTLIHIIQAMVGEKNYSTVGIQQLGTNRFAPAQLEGKLVNLSEESSAGGQEMDVEAMNVIKTLSAGGTLLVERKGQDGFTFTNQAKMIFSANHIPKFRETGHAIKRRMLVIPFDYRITAPDSRIENDLISEVPKIVAMLLRRIRENTGRNGGRFVVSRGGEAAEKAKVEVMFKGDTVREWASETLESTVHLGSEKYVDAAACYQAYREWCDKNGHRFPVNRISFGRVMCQSVITRAAGEESHVRKVGGKATRIYPFTQFKEGAIDEARA